LRVNFTLASREWLKVFIPDFKYVFVRERYL
jgi:hypothetical protein